MAQINRIRWLMNKVLLSIFSVFVFACSSTLKHNDSPKEVTSSSSNGMRAAFEQSPENSTDGSPLYTQTRPQIKFGQKPKIKLNFPRLNRLDLMEGDGSSISKHHQLAAQIYLYSKAKLQSSRDFEIASEPPINLRIDLKKMWLSSVKVLDVESFEPTDWKSFDSNFLIISSLRLVNGNFLDGDRIEVEMALYKINEQKIILNKKYAKTLSNSASVNILGKEIAEDILAFLTGTRDGSIVPKGTDRRLYSSISNEYLFEILPSIKKNIGIPEDLHIDIQLKIKPRINKTEVLIKFFSDGSIADKKIIRSSGNLDYDNIVLQAVEKASPFPKVPDRLTEVLKEDGLLLEFN